MKNKSLKRKSDIGNDDGNMIEYEHFRKERVTRNEEYLSSHGLANKEKLDSTENEHKQRANKGILLSTSRSQHIGRSINGDEIHNTNDDHVQEIGDRLVYDKSNLRELYLKLKQRFEPTSEDIDELPSCATPLVAKKKLVKPCATERTRITSLPSKVFKATPVVSTNLSEFSSPNSGFEDVTTFAKRRRISQVLYKSIEKEAKERKSKGKKAYVVHVKDGQPTGQNASRWASELGTRIRLHLDVTKSNFSDQDPRNVDQVIQQMENAFETIGGRISIKYYKHRMRILINNFRHKCRKLILDGKDGESNLTPKQWEHLKESMCCEDYIGKSTRGKNARDLVKVRCIYGRGGLRAKKHMLVEENNKEPGVDEMAQYMADRNLKDNKMSKYTTGSPLSSVQDNISQIGIASNVQNSSDDYNHVMECLNGLTEAVLSLASSIKLLVAAFNKGGSIGLDENIKGKYVIAKNLKYDNIDALEHFQSVPAYAGISNIDSACHLIPARLNYSRNVIK